MSIHVPEVSDSTIKELVTTINTQGWASIPNFLAPADLEHMQSFVDTAISRSNGEYVHFNGRDSVAGSGLEELADSPSFQQLIRRIFEQGTGRTGPDQKFYQVLRCLSGESGQKNSLIFHYDSYVVTALFPIRIPDSGKSGDLVMLPNTRKVRSSYWVNAVDKMMLDNPLTQGVLRMAARHKRLSLSRVKMQPGNLYLFWGYRSVHTNEPCDPEKVRATALFHYANPHRA